MNEQNNAARQMAVFYTNKALFWLLVIAIAIFTMAPFAYAISVSFRTNDAVLTGAEYIPSDPTLINFQNLFEDTRFLRTMLNSAFVSSITVTIALVVGSFAAYALGRVKFRGRILILYLVLSMTMFPQISILSGLFSLVNDIGLYGSTYALIFSYPIFTLPFTVWVLTSFFQGLPAELEQAALVDGATAFQTFWRILIPLTAPALVTTGLLAFIQAWNEYLFALTFTLVSPESQTVPVAIANFAGFSFSEPIADKIAAAVVVTIPLLVLVLIFQRRIIEGLTAGAVKG
jgi:trehalose/maltose transport system permease protein